MSLLIGSAVGGRDCQAEVPGRHGSTVLGSHSLSPQAAETTARADVGSGLPFVNQEVRASQPLQQSQLSREGTGMVEDEMAKHLETGAACKNETKSSFYIAVEKPLSSL